jgi:hypothetical protein
MIDWESDLADTIEGEFGVPVTLIFAGDGIRVSETVDGRPLVGKVRWSQPSITTEDGDTVAVPAPVVTLRRSSLSRVPATGETWYVEIPEGGRKGAPPKSYLLDTKHAIEGGMTLGKVRLPLVEAKQKGGA